MDISYLQVLQLFLLFAIATIACYIIKPLLNQTCRSYIAYQFINVNPYYVHYKVNLKRADIESFEKYEVWRYIEKKWSALTQIITNIGLGV